LLPRALQLDQLTRFLFDFALTGGREVALRAFPHLGRLERAAGRAFLRHRFASVLAGRWLALLASEQRLVMNVRHEPKAGVIIGMVEDQAVSLARCRPQAATDTLHEQDFGLRGS